MRLIKRTLAVMAVAGAVLGGIGIAARGTTNPRADIGRGEKVALVVGGTYLTRTEADVAASRWAAGEIEGFFVVPSDDFDSIEPGRWLLVSAFRTMRGAKEFEALAAAAGFPGTTRVVARYLGNAYIGLGQEPHPDGSGPLVHPLPAGHPARLG